MLQVNCKTNCKNFIAELRGINISIYDAIVCNNSGFMQLCVVMAVYMICQLLRQEKLSLNIGAMAQSSERALRPTSFRTACVNVIQPHCVRKQSGWRH